MTAATYPPAGPPAEGAPLPPRGLRPTAAPPGRSWATAVIALGAAVTALAALQAVLAGGYASDLERTAGTLDVTPTILAVGAVGFAQVGLLIASVVVTGLWLLRVRRFAERVDPRYPHSRRRWWAFGGWVVPIVSLWFPLQYTRDLRDSLRPEVPRTYGWWWAAWITSTVVDRYTASLGDDRAELQLLPSVTMVQAAVTLVAFVLWTRVVLHLRQCVEDVPDHVLAATALEPDPHAYPDVPPSMQQAGPVPAYPAQAHPAPGYPLPVSQQPLPTYPPTYPPAPPAGPPAAG